MISRRPWPMALIALPPLVGWWIAFYPGFYSPDSIDQFTQIATGRIAGAHPAAHTLYLSLLSLGGRLPGLVPLFQDLVLVGLLAVYAVMAARRGVPRWASGVAIVLVAVSPAIGQTTNAVWKDVPFALCMLWAWLEATALGTGPSRAGLVRLGIALGGVALFRQNGTLTVVLFLIFLLWSLRRTLRVGLTTAAVALALVVVVNGPVAGLANARVDTIPPAAVFLAEIAASYTSSPETFTGEDVALMESAAPLGLWEENYTCYESTPLVFDPGFDMGAVRADPDGFLDLETRVLLRDPDAVLAHRWCAASYLVVPAQPAGVYFHRPPYAIPDNDLGIVRRPLSDRAFSLFDRIFRAAEPDTRLWLTWRPGLVVIPAVIVALVGLVRRPDLRLGAMLFLIHLGNVALTSPSPEFRYALPLYLIGLLSWPLLLGRDGDDPSWDDGPAGEG